MTRITAVTKRPSFYIGLPRSLLPGREWGTAVVGPDNQDGSSTNRAEFRADTGAESGQPKKGSRSAHAEEDVAPCPQPPALPEEPAHGGRLAKPCFS